MDKSPVIALIVSGGSGQRYYFSCRNDKEKCDKNKLSSNDKKINYIPKQYQIICKKRKITVLGMSILSFLVNSLVDIVAVVINQDHLPYYLDTINNLRNNYGDIVDQKLKNVFALPNKDIPRRQDSVRIGLNHLRLDFSPKSKVLIHDGARPLVSQEIISEVINQLREGVRAVDVGIDLSDSLRYKKDSSRVNRSDYYAVQTPQGFFLGDIAEWHEEYKNIDLTDDISILSLLEKKIDFKFAKGDPNNIKITTYNDLLLAKLIINKFFPKK